MTTDDRTATTSTPADSQPTENLGAGSTAVLTDPAPERATPPRSEQHYGTPPVAPVVPAPVPSTPFSLTSLILGVTSVFFGLTVIAPIAGLVFGILGLRREPTGRTLAVWGIVLNAVMLGLVALMIVGLLFFGLLIPFVALATGTDYR